MNKLTVKIITDAQADARLSNPEIYRVNTLYLHAFIAERATIHRKVYPSLVCSHHILTGNIEEDLTGLKLDPYHLNGVYAQRDFVNPLIVTLDTVGNIRNVAGLDMRFNGYTYAQFSDELQRCIRKNVTMLEVTPPRDGCDAVYAHEIV